MVLLPDRETYREDEDEENDQELWQIKSDEISVVLETRTNAVELGARSHQRSSNRV